MERFGQPEYDFLRSNEDLKHCIYLTLSGSYGYGTNKDTSDIDLRGVLVEPDNVLYGIRNFEQFEELQTDTVIYGLKKYISLCVNANPNALELLGTEAESIVYQNDAGKMLRQHSDIFLTKRVIDSFGHYASAQLRRLANALCHDQYSEGEQQQHLLEVLNRQMDHFRSNYTSFGEHQIKLYLDDEDCLKFDVSLAGYPVRDFVRIYNEMSQMMKTYNKLNHRARKKDDAHLYKHAMHLIRLLITGIDILDGKGIVTKRVREHDFLMEIRNGVYNFDQIKQFAAEYQKRFAQAADQTSLPEKVDLKKVDQLMYEIYSVTGRNSPC